MERWSVIGDCLRLKHYQCDAAGSGNSIRYAGQQQCAGRIRRSWHRVAQWPCGSVQFGRIHSFFRLQLRHQRPRRRQSRILNSGRRSAVVARGGLSLADTIVRARHTDTAINSRESTVRYASNSDISLYIFAFSAGVKSSAGAILCILKGETS
jgi:hypothetical protein